MVAAKIPITKTRNQFYIDLGFQKLTNKYSTDKQSNSTLQDMVLLEKSTEKDLIAVDALMWLRR